MKFTQKMAFRTRHSGSSHQHARYECPRGLSRKAGCPISHCSTFKAPCQHSIICDSLLIIVIHCDLLLIVVIEEWTHQAPLVRILRAGLHAPWTYFNSVHSIIQARKNREGTICNLEIGLSAMQKNLSPETTHRFPLEGLTPAHLRTLASQAFPVVGNFQIQVDKPFISEISA